jgi:hypothetical protein
MAPSLYPSERLCHKYTPVLTSRTLHTTGALRRISFCASYMFDSHLESVAQLLVKKLMRYGLALRWLEVVNQSPGVNAF